MTFDDFYKLITNIFNHFQTFKPGSVNGRCGRLQIQKREPIKSIRIASDFTKQPWLEMANEGIVYIKNIQNNKMNIIQHIA